MGDQAAGRGIEPPSWASKAPVFPLDDPAEAALTRFELAVSSVTEKRGLQAPLQRQRVRERDLNPYSTDYDSVELQYSTAQRTQGDSNSYFCLAGAACSR
jgi:hypothetical protein